MVCLKVTDGNETRRFHVVPGEMTFDQLKEKISTLFPGSVKDVSEFTLQYHDTDGDIITISSNEEFQEALLDLPSDYVWKVYISPPSSQKKEEAGKNHSHSLFDLIFNHSHYPEDDLWLGFDKQLQRVQELLKVLCDSDARAEEDKTEGEGERGTTEGAKLHDNQTEMAEEEEVKSKPLSEAKVSPEKSSECPSCTDHHCYKIRIINNPLAVGRGLFGPRRYHIMPLLF